MKREYFLYGLGYLVFAMLFLGPLSYAGYREYEGKKAAEVLAQWKKDRVEQERLAEKAIAQLRSDYPKRSETMAENETPKIARGTTGQALKDYSDCDYGYDGYWGIDGPEVADINNPDGWNLTDSGVVTVPADATPGIYTGSYYISDPIACGDPEVFVRRQEYKFEVVCMKVTIMAVQN